MTLSQQQQPSLLLSQLVVLLLLSVSLAFAPATTSSSRPSTTRVYSEIGRLETLEFKIYDDGRVEETVRGIKGNNCQKVTEGINEMLGKVVATEPTEELYEQEVVVDNTLTQSVEGDNSSWEGSSSW